MHGNSVLIEVGKAIALIQFSDKLLKGVLLLVFPGKEINDFNIMLENQKKMDKATLGKLITILRSRVATLSMFSLSTYLTVMR